MPTPEELQLAVKTIAKDNLAAFAVAMQRDYIPSWHHQLICEKLEAVERGEIKRLMLFMPPRHGKSELASIKFPAWFIGRNPSKEIITASYSAELAGDFGRKVRNLVDDQLYKTIFDVQLAEDSKAKNRWHTQEGGGYVSAGVGGSVTGRGAHLLIIDDPIKNREEADSEVFRNKVWDWYNSTAYTRLAPNGALVLILTRWHDDDLAGRILQHEEEKWTLINLPAIAEHDEKYRRKGEALWPDRYSLEALLEIKSSIKDEFSPLYQQNPLNEELQVFKRAWFKYYRDWECPSNLRIYTTVDLAISEKTSADDTVIITVGIAPDNSKYILEYTNARLDLFETVEEIFRHFDRYEASIVGIESVGYQEALIQLLKKEMKLRNKFMNIEPILTRTDKQMKIRGLIPHYKSGVIYHRYGMCESLENQLLRFPKGQHDDIIDALAMQINLWNAPLYSKAPIPKHTGKTIKQLMQEEGLIPSR